VFSLTSCASTRSSSNLSSTPVSKIYSSSKSQSEASRLSVTAASPTSKKTKSGKQLDTKGVSGTAVVDFAETLVGTKYKYGSAVKENGFDCSGFVCYVFTNFDISVPRSSVDYTNVGKEVDLQDSKRGDLILFTGTDTTGRVVGHMGFITENINGKVKFIHSSSGKANGVVISDLSNYYKTRFVKVTRVFNKFD
jgi:cell wall-associated NlpC family hydrolase